MKKLGWLVVLGVLGSLLAVIVNVQAQAEPLQYFPLTGHTVRGDFLAFFNARGGAEILGYPITEAFIQDGRQVQYFQRMRLDLYPENEASWRVQTGPLGNLLGLGAPPISAADIPASGDPNRRYFPETGHIVVFSFLNFYNAHGGSDMFGLPITEYDSKNGIQYFQRARMEWHPNAPAEQRVRLGNLGETYAVLNLPQDLQNPMPRPDSLQVQTADAIRLKPAASLRKAVTGRTGDQTLHVYVLNQFGQAVQDATVSAIVHFPTGDQVLSLPQTDQRGYTTITFDLGQQPPGRRITVDVRVTFATLVVSTRTSFLVWW